ncbi:cell cycle checkpoint protein RAD17 isoform X1 [Astyanax mexicanus]|uniref:cell cycle checkpoint protein RAD17 isoform X1 n=1 Tax=Astyanax mexicanus TaxID=7994 RepID=UPI0020CB5F84|nr:cell cycle checkpoint protein RAD17 isoform X1 [Astyanax mexicanus]XP_022523978.2 cell cycle checkpoint protein RAD17 isoform X1 [Astyanax mexicanus]XP_022523979.2 cell cycle checkpoint protein RAD17 isoform X1 [Astyanax mexicanus]XP_022523980.2 cell cycle checkpoint protein RAD17 isoform X1 [Astyanax mexicanus]
MSKLSLRGKASSSKLSSWVQPSFGDLLGGSGLNSFSSTKGALAAESKPKTCPSSAAVSGKRPRKRKGDPPASKPQFFSSRQTSQEDQDEPWVDVHVPQSQAELAVHKKKVEEVESWLRVQLDLRSENKGGAVLLLTGPSGCGKTATVHVLAKDLGFQIQEWSNPNTASEYRTDDSFRQSFDPASRFNSFHGSSQTGAFQEFLLRANKYNRLQMTGDTQSQNRKAILVEDFPNQFYRQPGCLHDILRRFVKTGKCPLVFIVSDSLSGDTSSRLLFPKDIQQELGIHHISFNPVAPTSMMKVLSRIASIEASKNAGRISVPDKTVLDQLCSGSSGDIRSAINSLQFSSFTDNSLEKGLWASKKGKSAASAAKAPTRARGRSRATKSTDKLEDSPAIGGKDASLFLFRALGKILYCKREGYEGYEGSEVPKIPAHLAEHQRDRLLVDPEIVIERSHMSGEFFNLYLHQNYLDFFSNVEDVARASEYLSDADFFTAEWSSRSTMLQYGSSVATRGLIHSNSSRAQATSQSSVGFKPLHKPHWLQINKTYRENYLSAQSLFINFCLAPINLVTELVPYLAKLSKTMRNPAQIAFIQDVGSLSLKRFPGRLKLEALGDKDPGALDFDSENEDSTQTIKPGTSSSSGDPTAEPALQSNQEPGTDLPASQPQPTTTEALLDEEELLIEEYDSD